jgi:hypothetical protein
LGKLHRNVETAAPVPIGESSLAGCGNPGIAPHGIRQSRKSPQADPPVKSGRKVAESSLSAIRRRHASPRNQGNIIRLRKFDTDLNSEQFTIRPKLAIV